MLSFCSGMDEAGSMRPYIERFAKEQLIEKEHKCVIIRPSGYRINVSGLCMATLNPLDKQQRREMRRGFGTIEEKWK